MPKPHSEDTKRRARELYEQRGTRFAAEHLRIAPRTVQLWARQDGWTRHIASASDRVAQGQANRIGWAVRKRGEADHAGKVAADIRCLLEERVAAGKAAYVRDLAMAYSMLTERADKMSASTGGLDTPQMPPEAQVARLVELVDVVEQRKVGGDA
jgi:hypothetical protein